MPKREIVATFEIPRTRKTWRLDLEDLCGLASLCDGDGFGNDLYEAIDEIERQLAVEAEEDGPGIAIVLRSGGTG